MNSSRQIDYHGINIFNCNQLIYVKPSMKTRETKHSEKKSFSIDGLIPLFLKLNLAKNPNEDQKKGLEDDDLKNILKSVNKNIVKLNKICPSLSDYKQQKGKHKGLNLPLKKRLSEDYEKKDKKMKIIKGSFENLIDKKKSSAILVKIKRNDNDTYKIVEKEKLNSKNTIIGKKIISTKDNKSIEKESNLLFKRIKSNIFIDVKPLTGYENQACSCKKPVELKQMGCLDNCLNRMMFVECNPSSCPCGDKCSNQTIQKYQWCKDIEIFKTKDCGYGVRAIKSIKLGQLIMEYTGEVISVKGFEARSHTPTYNNGRHHYCLYVDRKCVIDARHKGSICRFVNHSCAPNCVIQKWSVNGLGRMVLVAKPTNSNAISAGTELTYDYNFTCFKGKSAQKCLCGSGPSICRGYITTTQNGSISNPIYGSNPVTSGDTLKISLRATKTNNNRNNCNNNNPTALLVNRKHSSKSIVPPEDSSSKQSKKNTVPPDKSTRKHRIFPLEKVSSSTLRAKCTQSMKSRLKLPDSGTDRKDGYVEASAKSTDPKIDKTHGKSKKKQLSSAPASVRPRGGIRGFNSISRFTQPRHLAADSKSKATSLLAYKRSNKPSQYDIFKDIVREASSPTVMDQNVPVLRRNQHPISSPIKSTASSLKLNSFGRTTPISSADVLKLSNAADAASVKPSSEPPTTLPFKTLRPHMHKPVKKSLQNFASKKKSAALPSTTLSAFTPLNKKSCVVNYSKKKNINLKKSYSFPASPTTYLLNDINSMQPLTCGTDTGKSLKRKSQTADSSGIQVKCNDTKKLRKTKFDKQFLSGKPNTIEKFWLFNFYLHHARTPVCIVTRLLLAFLIDKNPRHVSNNSRNSKISTLTNTKIAKIFGGSRATFKIFSYKSIRRSIASFIRKLRAHRSLYEWFLQEFKKQNLQQRQTSTTLTAIDPGSSSNLDILKEIYLLVKNHQDIRCSIKDWNKHPIHPFMSLTSSLAEKLPAPSQVHHHHPTDQYENTNNTEKRLTCFQAFEKKYLDVGNSSTKHTFKEFDDDFNCIIEHFKSLHRSLDYRNRIGHKKCGKMEEPLTSLVEIYATIVNARIHCLRRCFPCEEISLKDITQKTFVDDPSNYNPQDFHSDLFIKKEETLLDDTFQENSIIAKGGSCTDDIYLDAVDCHCRILREEGTMIQCETCCTWQHTECVNEIYNPRKQQSTPGVIPLPPNEKARDSSDSLESTAVLKEITAAPTTYNCYKCLGKIPPSDIKLYTALVQDYDYSKGSSHEDHGRRKGKVKSKEKANKLEIGNEAKLDPKIHGNSKLTQNVKNSVNRDKCHELTYYWTMASHDNTSKIKCGECYYIVRATATTRPDPSTISSLKNHQDGDNVRGSAQGTKKCLNTEEMDIFRCLYLFTDTSGKRWAQGHHFFRPSETFHEPSRRFYVNELLLVYVYETVPLDSIYKPCWVLDYATFCKGRPLVEKASYKANTNNVNETLDRLKVGANYFSDLILPDERDVYICQLKVDRKARKFDRVKFKYNCIQKAYCFRFFTQPLCPKRIYFPHEIPKHYAQLDPNLKYLRIESTTDAKTIDMPTAIKTSSAHDEILIKPDQYEEHVKPIFDKLIISDVFKSTIPLLISNHKDFKRNHKTNSMKKSRLENIIQQMTK